MPLSRAAFSRLWVPPAQPPLPTWVPAAGEVRVLTQSNGFLSNRFRDQVASNYTGLFYVKTVNDFSTSYPNPHWGQYGALVFFGGGHGGTNDNSVTVAELGATQITYKRMTVPTNWSTADPDDETNIYIAGDLNSYFEGPDGQVGSPHTYGAGEIIGPEHGGATYGTLEVVMVGAVGYNGTGAGTSGYVAHKCDFDTMTLGSRKWVRKTNNTGDVAWPGNMAVPWYDVFVPAQNRTYVFHQGGGLPATVKYFDRATNTYIQQGTGSSLEIDTMDGFDSGNVFYVPSRNLIVGCWPVSGSLRVQWMDVSVSEPTLGTAVTLTQALSVSDPWSMACWCEDNNRILIGGVTGNSDAVYEIEIPTPLSNNWTVTRRQIPNGGTIPNGDSTSPTNGRTYKKWRYHSKVKSIVYQPTAAPTGDDQVWIYRPVGV